jgi:lipopolysaccharide transport system ATP-binding protein
MKPIIEVNHVWKEYQKGIDRRYKSLRDSISGISDLLWKNTHEKFWALEDIDFKVEAGESIGIIGRNGAGKSTLLKILSRITPPTKGEVIMRGRVASLLEVGTGFHPELTGRENIFFNGSILGMKHREIKQKFDQIVDFSGVQSFIDTPLKHYSSGMQMRLAFSVAAHLDSEILLIDEVLAVGDADFQKKCIGKMDEVSKGEGKTILFVSHDLKAINKLTNRIILMKDGFAFLPKNKNTGISEFLGNSTKNIKNYEGDSIVQKIYVTSFEHLEITCEYEIKNTPYTPHMGIIVSTVDGSPIFGTNPTLSKMIIPKINYQCGSIVIKVVEPKLKNGIYNLSVWLGNGVEDFFSDVNCLQFEINSNIHEKKLGFIEPTCKFIFFEKNI